jgi:predicted DNA-binding mobile mystery protein A
MNTSRLQIEQLNNKLITYKSVEKTILPTIGWIKTIRTSIGMSLEQLGNKLGISKQSVQQLEKRESEGAVTIHTLEEVARAMDMKLVYGFVPVDGSVDKLIERKARALATEIVMRTSNTMKLENQQVSSEKIQQAIEERTKQLMDTLPKILWD